jgi:hypothetical protein
MKHKRIKITQEMIDEAIALTPQTKVNRTRASKIDSLTGNIGEFIFAQYYLGDWRKHQVVENKGEIDFDNIEIKTSAFPFNNKLNLLVREDYAAKRKPDFYVQIIIDVKHRNADIIHAGTDAVLCGFATHSDLDHAEKRDFGSKSGWSSGYKCYAIPITELHSVDKLPRNNAQNI